MNDSEYPQNPAAPNPGDANVDPQAMTAAMTSYENARRKGLVAWLLWLFLGAFGAHRFYFGHTNYAVAMLLLGWLTLGIWPLVDGLFINRNLRSINEVAWEMAARRFGVPVFPLPQSAT